MITLRQILIAAWLILLLTVFLRRVDGVPFVDQTSQANNQIQIMRVVDQP
jgi:hypothetical protein